VESVIPDFAGKVIASARIDYGLHLWTSDNWEILMAGDVQVSGPESSRADIEVDVAESPLPAEFEGVVGSSITQLLVAEDGRLSLLLGDRQLSVRADQSYEAWQISGSAGERLICMPGGKLAYIPPLRRNGAARPGSENGSFSSDGS
jgi:hypothetical protein